MSDACRSCCGRQVARGTAQPRAIEGPAASPRASLREPPQELRGSPLTHMKSGDRGPEAPGSGPKSPSKRRGEPNGNPTPDAGPALSCIRAKEEQNSVFL